MKKMLTPSSSLCRGGNSDTLCDEFPCGVVKASDNAEKVFLRDKATHYCTGCNMYSLYGKPCPQKDDATEVIGKVLAADAIVVSAPVYLYTMLARMRTLIDRCCSQYTKMAGKEFYFIVTAAEDDRKKVLRTIDAFQEFLDCLENPTVKGIVCGLRVWYAGEIKGNPIVQEVYEIGKSIQTGLLPSYQVNKGDS